MKNWIAYRLTPIDHLWEMLPTVEEIAKKFEEGNRNRLRHLLGEFDAPGDFCGFEVMSLDEVLSDLSDAQHLARRAGWEGDYRSEETQPRVYGSGSGLRPFTYAFVWKQDNNGSTFVVSPRPLDWLGEYDVAYPDEPERLRAARFSRQQRCSHASDDRGRSRYRRRRVAIPYDAPGMPKPRCNGAESGGK